MSKKVNKKAKTNGNCFSSLSVDKESVFFSVESFLYFTAFWRTIKNCILKLNLQFIWNKNKKFCFVENLLKKKKFSRAAWNALKSITKQNCQKFTRTPFTFVQTPRNELFHLKKCTATTNQRISKNLNQILVKKFFEIVLFL